MLTCVHSRRITTYKMFRHIQRLRSAGIKQSVFCVGQRTTVVATNPEADEEWINAKPFEEIPGPKALPIIGNIWRFLPVIGDIPLEFADQHKYFYDNFGSIARMPRIPGMPNMVILFNPDDIEKVLRNEGPWPIRLGANSILYYRMEERKDVFQGVAGTIVTQGKDWHDFRSKVNQIMMQPRATKLYVQPIDVVASDFILRIRTIRDDKLEMPPDFRNELNKWALESIVYIALDTRLGCLADNLQPDSEPQKMIDSVHKMLDCMYKLDMRPSVWRWFSTPTYREFIKVSDYFVDVCMKYITQAMERLKNLPEDGDRELTVLEKILARDPNPRTAMVMALDMMTAGVDTTSYSTAIALYFLGTNPDKQQKLFEEIVHYLPHKDEEVTSEILNELKYLKACIKESMRLKPIVLGTARTTVKDIVLSGYRVPKGVLAGFGSYHMSNMEKYFPQADKYMPERWLKSTDGKSSAFKHVHPFVYMPFGFGPRMCLGRRFAELELETVLTKLIRNFRVEWNYGEMKFKSMVLYTPDSPLKFKFVDRE